MTMRAYLAFAGLSTLWLVAAAPIVQAQTYTTFRIQNMRDTVSSGINTEGTLVGSMWKKDYGGGFVRTPDGTVTATEHPLSKIDKSGIAIGSWTVGKESMAYLRMPNGEEMDFGAPDAGRHGTVPNDLNPKGAVVGAYADGKNAWHAFLRIPNGKIEEFDAPGCAATYADAINASGMIAGECGSRDGGLTGFVRAPHGTFAAFAAAGMYQTTVVGMNGQGTITGRAIDESNVAHGYVRSASGDISTFDSPGAAYTMPFAINKSGVIVGLSEDTGSGSERGFLRVPDGTITIFDVPHTRWTWPLAINDVGVVTGICGKGGRTYGFVRTP
jgi:hypothetical protein